MKKYFFIPTLIFFTAFSLSAQSIKITSPHTGDTWFTGGKYLIKWTDTGTNAQYVKIRLFNAQTGEKTPLVDSAENTGSYEWNIGFSTPPGNYYIRVKTTDNNFWDDGTVFEIKSMQIYPNSVIDISKDAIKVRFSPDLKLTITADPISPEVNGKLAIKFNVENIGRAKSIPCALRVFMGQEKTDQWIIPEIRPGRNYSLTKKLITKSAGYYLCSATVDDGKFNDDPDRTNNHAKLKITVRGPDLKITKISTPDYKKTVQQKCIMDVVVTNVGHANAGNFEIDCNWHTCPLIAQGRKYAAFNGVLKPGESTTFRFTHRYACLGMKYPSLYVDKANNVKEENENNNACGFVFHLSAENITGRDAPKVITNCND